MTDADTIVAFAEAILGFAAAALALYVAWQVARGVTHLIRAAIRARVTVKGIQHSPEDR